LNLIQQKFAGYTEKDKKNPISLEMGFLFCDHGGNTFVQSFKINYNFDICKDTNKINT
jgi:hypothetical protein